MSHPNDEGNSVVSRAFSAIRKRREGKFKQGPDTSGQRPAQQEPRPEEAHQGEQLSQEEPGGDSHTDPVVDSTDIPATESGAPAADVTETPDTAETTTDDEAPTTATAESATADEPDNTETSETATEDTVAEEPTVEEPAAEKPATEERATEEPVVDEPAEGPAPAAEAGAAEPVDEEVVADEPVTDETQAEEPAEAVAEPPVDEPAIPAEEESAVAEPATDIPADADAEAEAESETGAAVPIGTSTDGDPAAEATDDVAEGPADDVPGDDSKTTTFAAVPAGAAAVAGAATVAGSPADENKTEVIATDPSAKTEVIDAQTEKINIAKPTATAPPASGWKAEPAAPQYIPPGGGTPQSRPSAEQPKKSRKGLWIGLAALVVIIAVVAAVIGLVSANGESSEPAADVAAARALEYTTALRDGDIIVLRSITCGEAQARFTSMSDQEFAEDHRVQEANNELVGVDGVKASKIVDNGNGAVVEVSAFKTGTPDEKLDVALTLSKIDGEWKVCKA